MALLILFQGLIVIAETAGPDSSDEPVVVAAGIAASGCGEGDCSEPTTASGPGEDLPHGGSCEHCCHASGHGCHLAIAFQPFVFGTVWRAGRINTEPLALTGRALPRIERPPIS
ncbi:hypothetical protein [Halomonas denitrificans]|nr:hypothetical protein [Halomonas denitrificans]